MKHGTSTSNEIFFFQYLRNSIHSACYELQCESKCFDKVSCRAAMLTKKKASSPINLNTSDDKISESALLLSPVLISCKSNWNVSNM